MRSIILYILSIVISTFVSGQNPKKYIREGNKFYEQKKYNDAEILAICQSSYRYYPDFLIMPCY